MAYSKYSPYKCWVEKSIPNVHEKIPTDKAFDFDHIWSYLVVYAKAQNLLTAVNRCITTDPNHAPFAKTPTKRAENNVGGNIDDFLNIKFLN